MRGFGRKKALIFIPYPTCFFSLKKSLPLLDKIKAFKSPCENQVT
jgi:hypothetical protein